MLDRILIINTGRVYDGDSDGDGDGGEDVDRWGKVAMNEVASLYKALPVIDVIHDDDDGNNYDNNTNDNEVEREEDGNSNSDVDDIDVYIHRGVTKKVIDWFGMLRRLNFLS